MSGGKPDTVWWRKWAQAQLKKHPNDYHTVDPQIILQFCDALDTYARPSPVPSEGKTTP